MTVILYYHVQLKLLDVRYSLIKSRKEINGENAYAKKVD